MQILLQRSNVRKSLHPLPRCEIPNYRVVLEVRHSPTEATIGDEEHFDLSLESLEFDCKRMRLNLIYESIESEESPETDLALENMREEGHADNPESPDETLSSEIITVEQAAHEESVTSSRVLEYLEQVQQEDSSSYFVTLPGKPRRISFQPISPLRKPKRNLHPPVNLCHSCRYSPDNPAEAFLSEEWPCHIALPVWDVAANASELGEDTVAFCYSPGGTSIVNSNH